MGRYRQRRGPENTEFRPEEALAGRRGPENTEFGPEEALTGLCGLENTEFRPEFSKESVFLRHEILAATHHLHSRYCRLPRVRSGPDSAG